MESKQERQRRSQREWYTRNRHTQKKWVRGRRSRVAIWVKELKNSLSCLRCGESHPACLDFHHRDPKDKDASISDGITNGWGKERLELEIAKCDVLCANCHRKEHYVPV